MKITDIKDISFNMKGVRHGHVDLAGHRYVLNIEVNGKQGDVQVNAHSVHVDPAIKNLLIEAHQHDIQSMAGKDVSDLIEENFHLAHKYQSMYDRALLNIMQ